jgi:hypothetical protein
MNDTDARDRLFVARAALVLFVLGLLVPFIIAVLGMAFSRLGGDADTAALLGIGCGFVCEGLAFVLGLVGRRHVSGKIGMFGGVIVLVLALACSGMAFLRYSNAAWAAKQKTELLQKAQQDARDAAAHEAGKQK